VIEAGAMQRAMVTLHKEFSLHEAVAAARRSRGKARSPEEISAGALRK
jgi:hypothetical protein